LFPGRIGNTGPWFRNGFRGKRANACEPGTAEALRPGGNLP